MQNENYVTFDILGVCNNGFKDTFCFNNEAVCEISNDSFIKRVVVSADVSVASFYLNDSLVITDEVVTQVINYLYTYLGSMMISLLKHCSHYSNVQLMPTIRIASTHFVNWNAHNITVNDHIGFRDAMVCKKTLKNGDEILSNWISDVDVTRYSDKEDRYSILFLLLQSQNMAQKYMAMYAFLMSLVRELKGKTYDSQRMTVCYISENCARVGITKHLTPSTDPRKRDDVEDQFTRLRNQIGHPDVQGELVNFDENDINGLASIICCALEDLPS